MEARITLGLVPIRYTNCSDRQVITLTGGKAKNRNQAPSDWLFGWGMGMLRSAGGQRHPCFSSGYMEPELETRIKISTCLRQITPVVPTS